MISTKRDHLNRLSGDEVECVAGFLWFKDLLRFSACNKSLNQIIKSSNAAWNLFINLMMRSGIEISSDLNLELRLPFQAIISLALRVTPWPTDVDSYLIEQFSERATPIYSIREVFTPNQTSRCFSYQGVIQGKNRAIVSNNHFPLLFGHNVIPASRIRPASAVPFVKVITNAEREKVPVLSCIAYYEIKIHACSESLRMSSSQHIVGNNDGVSQVPCIVVGIARPGFPLVGKMPGWDRNSHGYHGDDGLYYHGNSINGQVLTQDDNLGTTFGENDVVGCGIIYPPLLYFGAGNYPRLFFTKNGQFVGSAVLKDDYFFDHAWFAAVGTDARNPIEFNFGHTNEPFAFDILLYERTCFHNWNTYLYNSAVNKHGSLSFVPVSMDSLLQSDCRYLKQGTNYGCLVNTNTRNTSLLNPLFKNAYDVFRGDFSTSRSWNHKKRHHDFSFIYNCSDHPAVIHNECLFYRDDLTMETQSVSLDMSVQNAFVSTYSSSVCVIVLYQQLYRDSFVLVLS
jgi:hypothetical protein